MVFFLIGCLMGHSMSDSLDLYRVSRSPVFRNGNIRKGTVLVTGGLGFIGSHVVEDLTENGFNVIVYDDMSNGRNFNKDTAAILLKDITVVKDFSFINVDVDYVVHLAAAISVTESVAMPEKYERTNVEGSRHVFEWARLHHVRKVVAASSAACYGIPKAEDIPLAETSANGGISPYSQTKYKMEDIMREYTSKHKLRTTALRFFNVYGPRQDPKSDYSGVISWFMDQAQMNGKIKITGDGYQYRDFVYVKDVARAIRTAMLYDDPEFDVFNVCTQRKTTVNDLAREIVKVFQSSAEIVHIDPRPGDVKESLCNAAKARKKLGFEAEYNLAQGLEQTHAWFVEAFES